MEIGKTIAALVQPDNRMLQISKQRTVLSLFAHRTIQELRQEKRYGRFVRIVGNGRKRIVRLRLRYLIILVRQPPTAGLALQDLLKNVVSGLVILINKPFVSGNILDFEGVKGTVEEINIFSTTVHTLDNKLVTIPNSRLTSNNVVNCTMVEQRRVDCTFSVSYDDDIDKVREIILNLMATNEMILKDPEPTVRVGEHLDSGVQIKVFAWATPDDYYEVYFFLQENVKKEFDKNGITIPYPHLVIAKD